MATCEKSDYEPYKADGIWGYVLTRKKVVSRKLQTVQRYLKTANGSTKGLYIHLKSKHNIDVMKRSSECCAPSIVPAKKSSGDITRFLLEDNSLQSAASRMTACDGLPFRVFVSSLDIQKGLEARGLRLVQNQKRPFRSWS